MITRRFAIGSTVAAALAIINRHAASAQYTKQEVSNGLQVVSTGNVNVDQAASGSQSVDIFGQPLEDGIYRTTTGQMVVNDGQIVATGDVNVRQSASGTQTVRQLTVYDGQPADRCDPGHVIADPNTGLIYYQANDCCYYLSPCCQQSRCKSGKC